MYGNDLNGVPCHNTRYAADGVFTDAEGIVLRHFFASHLANELGETLGLAGKCIRGTREREHYGYSRIVTSITV